MDPEATPATAPSSDSGADVGDLAASLFPDEPEEGAESGEQAEADETPAEASEESEGGPEEQAEGSPRHKVKVNGEEREVTLDELLKGYSRTEDYKQKTAQLAEEKRGIDRALEQRLAPERQRRTAAMSHFVQMVEGGFDPVISKGMKTDWAARMREDPVNGPAEKAEFDQKLAQFQHARQTLARNAENEHLERVRWNHQELVKQWPEWGDDTKRAEIQDKLRPHFKAYGFTDDEINGTTDYRAFLAMKDAAELREWKANISKAKQKQVKDAPKVATPKATKAGPALSGRAKALEEKAKSGNARAVGELAAALDWSQYQ